MKKLFAMLMICSALLALTACGTKPNEDTSAVGDQQTQEPTIETMPQLTRLPELTIAAEETAGRVPGGAYTLPTEVIDLVEWEQTGAVGLLAEDGSAAFYAVEGKESNPALLCWGKRQAEFDWAYITPRAIGPALWLCDPDGDGKEELLVNCYGGSGTGVSLDYLHVVERSGDTLTDYALPWDGVKSALNEHLQVFATDRGIHAALGLETVDITAALGENTPADLKIELGEIAYYDWDGEQLTASFGVVANGEGIPPLSCYVANVEAALHYADGVFTLTEVHLSAN